jgi:putative transposase
MASLAKGSGTAICAYTLMTNHLHILLKSGESGLSTYIRRLLSSYAQFYNRRHKRAGHLFQNRYKSIICEEEAYSIM